MKRLILYLIISLLLLAGSKLAFPNYRMEYAMAFLILIIAFSSSYLLTRTKQKR